MDDFLNMAIELTKAQASVRVMQEDELMDMIRSLSASLRRMSEGTTQESDESLTLTPARSIKEKKHHLS